MFKNNWRRQRGSSSQTHSWRSKFFHLLITFKLCALVFYPVYRLQKLYFRISENPLFLNKDLTFYFCGRSSDSQLGVTVALHHCWRSISPPWLPPSHHDFWRQRWRHWVGLTFGPFIIHSLVKDQLLPPRFRSTRTSYSSFGYHPSLPIPSFPLSSNPSNHANSPHAMVLVHVMVQIRFLVLAHAM